MYTFLLSILGFLFVLHATATDIKKREVLDFVSYGLLSCALSIRLMWSLLLGTWDPFLYGLFGFGIFFVLGMIMFYAGQWGGGDTKILFGIGAALGFDGTLLSPILIFFVLMLLIGSIYGLLYSVALSVQNKKQFIDETHKLWKVPSTKPILISAVGIVLLCIIVYRAHESAETFILFSIGLIIGLFTVLIYYIRIVETSCMLKEVSPLVLTEGDWISQDVVYKGKILCGPKDLGIEKTQIVRLQKLHAQKKITTVVRKNGIPFVPSLFLAYCGALLFIFL